MDNGHKISAVILAKNEENNLVDCLESISWCDEIILIDDNSTDRTVEVAKKHKITVFIHSLNGDFSAQRNFGLSKTSNEWVLFIDADERLSEGLKKEIQLALRSPKANGYFIPRADFMWGRKLKHGEQGNIKLIRLAKKSAGQWQGKVHETWNVAPPIGYLKNAIIHYPHQALNEFLREINMYSSIRAKELFDNGKTAGFWSVILYPKAKFLQNYIFKLGFLDGMQGFIVAILMSLHSFLVRGKLWQLTEKQ